VYTVGWFGLLDALLAIALRGVALATDGSIVTWGLLHSNTRATLVGVAVSLHRGRTVESDPAEHTTNTDANTSSYTDVGGSIPRALVHVCVVVAIDVHVAASQLTTPVCVTASDKSAHTNTSAHAHTNTSTHAHTDTTLSSEAAATAHRPISAPASEKVTLVPVRVAIAVDVYVDISLLTLRAALFEAGLALHLLAG
jgi:hypothetical protein